MWPSSEAEGGDEGPDRRLRLVLVSRRYPPLIGGAERMMANLARALAAEGHDVIVLTASVPGRDDAEAGEVRDPGGFDIVRLPTSSARFLGTLVYMASLRRWLMSHDFDLVYVSMLKHDAYVAVGAGRARGFPVVLRPEGAGATGDLAWQRWGRFGRAIGRRCRKADAVVAISPAVRAELLDAGYDPDRIIDIPNGVALPEPPWRPRPDWQRRPRALVLGRLSPEKGPDVAIDAWKPVLSERPSARLSLVGDGPRREDLQKRIDDLGLTDAVELVGPTDDPGGWLRDSDLFVQPSREEGMSLALLEAMALGLPVVATAIPGNRGLIDDEVHGLLAPPDDPPALARTILKAWDDFEAAQARAVEARKRVDERYSLRAVARAHRDLFRKRIGDGRAC